MRRGTPRQAVRKSPTRAGLTGSPAMWRPLLSPTPGSLSADGLALPTVLPAKELRADTVWRMMDGRIFHLEFQTQRESALYRFLSYDTRLATQHQAPVRTVVLYHAGVTQAPDHIDLGVIHYQIENVYLTQLDGDAALRMVAQHLAAHAWEPPARLRLALALCVHADDRRALFGQTLALLPQVPPDERDLVTAAISTN